jgi:putative restriction endonuclease
MRLEDFLVKLGKIRCAPTAYGPAPHKPVFLITLLDRMDRADLAINQFEISPEWVALFKGNWSLLVDSQNQSEFGLPFFHLQTDGFWKVIRWDGTQLKSVIKSMFVLAEEVHHCALTPEVYALCADPENRRRIRTFLLERYFPRTQSVYNKERYIPVLEDEELAVLNETQLSYTAQEDEDMGFIRSGAFQRVVLRVYNHTCSISGLRVVATSGISMVDACHITPFHQTGDNSISNGFTLCPNLHRAFDRGLIAVDAEYRVVVSRSFVEDQSSYGIRRFEGQPIQLPLRKKYFPSVEKFAWHREKVFRG